jgi:hypothetical protein
MPCCRQLEAANKFLQDFEPESKWARLINVTNRARRRDPMITFQLVGLVFSIMFLGALFTGNADAAR